MKSFITLGSSALLLVIGMPVQAEVFTVVCKSSPPEDVIRIDTANGSALFVQNVFIAGQTRPAEVDDFSIRITFAPNAKWVIDRSSGYLSVEDFVNGSWMRRCPECTPIVCERAKGAI